MSPLNHNLETVDSESGASAGPRLSDMRRVSMSLAFSPARHRRRRNMSSANSWFKSRLGINWRRSRR